jgi:hypothetical protein
MSDANHTPRSIPVAALRDRLKRDRYSLDDAYDAVDHAMRKGWNDAMGHVEQLIATSALPLLATSTLGYCECPVPPVVGSGVAHEAYCPARGQP